MQSQQCGALRPLMITESRVCVQFICALIKKGFQSNICITVVRNQVILPTWHLNQPRQSLGSSTYMPNEQEQLWTLFCEPSKVQDATDELSPSLIRQ